MSAAPPQIRPGSPIDRFIQAVRRSIEQASTMSELLRRVSAHMRETLTDPDLRAPDQPRLTYRDPDYLFQVNASDQRPDYYAQPHDHGECWAVYGFVDGSMRMTRYERVDDGSDADFAELRTPRTFEVRGGECDVIEPWGIHELKNTTGQPVRVFVIRSRSLNEVWRNRFDIEKQTVHRIRSTRLRSEDGSGEGAR